MRTLTKWIVISFVIAGGFLAYFKGYSKWKLSQSAAIKTEHPTRKDIVRKKSFSGHLKPHKEIALKPNISGVVEKLLVQVGDYVQQGAAIARIKVQPTIQAIEQAESALRTASITLNAARAKYFRDKQLFRKKMLAKEAYETSVQVWALAKETLSQAEKVLQATRSGYTKGKGKDANVVKATTKGTILSLPVKEGSMVQPMQGQAEGTVVAVIGDMDHFLFSADVNELDAVHLTKGMSFQAKLNAFKEEYVQVTLTKIALTADTEALKSGEVKFAIEGIITKPKNSKIVLRSGYIAVAEVVVEQAKQVLAISEKMIGTEGKTNFVKCWQGNAVVKKNVVLGLTDGLYAEVKEGLTEEDQLIVEE